MKMMNCFALAVLATLMLSAPDIFSRTIVRATGTDRVSPSGEQVYVVNGKVVERDMLKYIPINYVKDIYVIPVPQSIKVCGPQAKAGAVIVTLLPGRQVDGSRIARGRLDKELARIFPVQKEKKSCSR